jgi:hypothetical protein
MMESLVLIGIVFTEKIGILKNVVKLGVEE